MPGPRVGDERRADLFLAELVFARCLARVDQQHARAELRGVRRVGQAVADDDVGAVQCLPAAQRDQVRGARAGPDKGDATGGRQRRARERGGCGLAALTSAERRFVAGFPAVRSG